MGDKVKREVQTLAAPSAIGPYSQAVCVGQWVFCSGQVALEPGGEDFVTGEIAVQTRRCLLNLQAVLQAAGATFADVVKTTVYLTNFGDFGAFNEVYREFVSDPAPARATVMVSGLPKGALVEIDAIAVGEDVGRQTI